MSATTGPVPVLSDARKIPDDTTLVCDICIVGAGAAGITLACELDRAGMSVILLEAGGARFQAAAQEAYRGEVDPASIHSPPDMYRRQVLGGSTSIWGGRCIPLDPIDFETRDHVPHSGWPVTHRELLPYYRRAQRYVHAGDFAYTVSEALPGAAPTVAGLDCPDLDADRVERFSLPTDFGKVFRPVLARSANVNVVLNARCTGLETDEGGAVAALHAAGVPERRFTVLAGRYVLAAGGLEATRILLASDGSRRGGLGNQSGHLGRYYMCHIENTVGRLRVTPARRPVVFDFERTADGVYVRRKFVLSEAAQRRHALPNVAFRLHHPLIADPSHGSGILSAMYVLKDTIIPEYKRKLAAIEIAGRDRLVRDRRFWAAHMRNILRDTPELAKFGPRWIRHRNLARRKLPFVVMPGRDGCYPLEFNAEQVPNPDSRVRLGGELDEYGMPRIVVDWRMTGQDVDNMARTYRLLRDSLAATRCAELEFEDERLEEQLRHSTPVGGHHIGTARMADSPRDGVVDAQGRVFGAPNLYVTGSATFPTCGHANPTLSIVAFALRLADHLRADWARPAIGLGAVLAADCGV